MTLERAIKRITSEPANYFGIKGRGRLRSDAGRRRNLRLQKSVRPGAADAQRSPGRRTTPGDAGEGIEYTVVNGDMLYEHGPSLGYLPGQVLRSGTQ